MSRLTVESLHIEGLKNIPVIANVQVQSVASFNVIDIQACEFNNAHYKAFDINNSGVANVKIFTLRQDCKKLKGTKLVLSNNMQRLKVEQIIDAIKLF